MFDKRNQDDIAEDDNDNNASKEDDDNESFETMSAHSADNAQLISTEEAIKQTNDCIVLSDDKVTKLYTHDIT